MKEIEKYYVNRLLANVGLEKGVQCKREVRIIEDCIEESTLDIWTVKDIVFPETNQYEIYKCFILEFEFSFGGFINPNKDLFHYSFKNIVYCDKVGEVCEDNIRKYFENGMRLDIHTSSDYIKKVIYENGIWYLKG